MALCIQPPVVQQKVRILWNTTSKIKIDYRSQEGFPETPLLHHCIMTLHSRHSEQCIPPHFSLVVEVLDEAVGVVVGCLVERLEEGEIVPVSVPLVAHVVGHTACERKRNEVYYTKHYIWLL